MQRRCVETDEVFAKENTVLGEEFQAVTKKLRELQAREAALHTSAAVRFLEARLQPPTDPFALCFYSCQEEFVMRSCACIDVVGQEDEGRGAWRPGEAAAKCRPRRLVANAARCPPNN